MRATRHRAARGTASPGHRLRLAEPLGRAVPRRRVRRRRVAILMPDLSVSSSPGTGRCSGPVVRSATSIGCWTRWRGLHAMPWAEYRATTSDWAWPWRPLRERLASARRPSAERYRAEGRGRRRLRGRLGRLRPTRRAERAEPWSPGWRQDPAPLLAAARPIAGDGPPRRPQARERGAPRRRPGRADRLADDDPGAGRGRARLDARLELGVAPARARGGHGALSRDRRSDRPVEPASRGPVCRRRPRPGPRLHLATTTAPSGRSATRTRERDLTWIVGLLLRGSRKALDAEADVVLGSGVRAADDLAWWSAQVVEAAGRRLP